MRHPYQGEYEIYIFPSPKKNSILVFYKGKLSLFSLEKKRFLWEINNKIYDVALSNNKLFGFAENSQKNNVNLIEISPDTGSVSVIKNNFFVDRYYYLWKYKKDKLFFYNRGSIFVFDIKTGEKWFPGKDKKDKNYISFYLHNDRLFCLNSLSGTIDIYDINTKKMILSNGGIVPNFHLRSGNMARIKLGLPTLVLFIENRFERHESSCFPPRKWHFLLVSNILLTNQNPLNIL